ncbi:MAG: hypothetical protein ACLUNO_01985 [Oscillospiraceae bacterium]
MTIPYKKAVIPYCAELSPIAQKLGSVNALVRRPDGTLYGDNADAFGFELSGAATAASTSREEGARARQRRRVARPVCAVLEQLGAASVTVISRHGPGQL